MTGLLSLLLWIPYLTGGSQAILDTYGGMYVENIHYIAVHNYTRLGKRLIQDLQRDKPTMITCSVSKTIINHKKETTAILTGADYYIQICTNKKDYSYLYKIKC